MVRSSIHSEVHEIGSNSSHALLSWRSIVAGLLVSMFSMIGLIGLGLAFGGIGLDESTSAKSAGLFTGIWFLASTLVSLFLGSYFAARVSKFRMGRIGSAQGLVIAALFLGFFLYQTIVAIGSVGSAAGSFLGKTGSLIASGAERAATNPVISNTVSNLAEDALGDLNLKSGPQVVAEGLGTRLVRGDTESAKNYLAREAGITPNEADARIAEMKVKVDETIANAKEGTAAAMKSTGWSLFLLVVLGSVAGMLGGGLGSVANFRKPLIRETSEAVFSGPAQHA